MTNWYYTVILTNMVKNPLVADKIDLKGRSQRDFFRGEPILDWDESTSFTATTKMYSGDPDDVLANAKAIPIYSTRLREALDGAGIAGIQYLPVQVYRRDGSSIPGFAIANVLDFLPVLDLERSVYDLYGDRQPARRDEIAGLWKPVLRKDALEGYDVIRPRESYTDLYVSERFRRVFKAGGFTGYTFGRLRRS